MNQLYVNTSGLTINIRLQVTGRRFIIAAGKTFDVTPEEATEIETKIVDPEWLWPVAKVV